MCSIVSALALPWMNSARVAGKLHRRQARLGGAQADAGGGRVRRCSDIHHSRLLSADSGQAAFESGADFGLQMLPDPRTVAERVVGYWRQQVARPAGRGWIICRLQQAAPDDWRGKVAVHRQSAAPDAALLPLADVTAELAAVRRLSGADRRLWRNHGSAG